MKRLLLIAAVLASGCTVASAPAGQSPPGANTSPRVVTNSASVIDTNVKTLSCAAEGRLAALSLSNGLAFWTAFPNAAKAPELADVGVRLIAVVYANGWPGAITGRFGVTPAPRQPGTWDVCVETADGSDAIGGQSFIVYGSISSARSIVPGA